mgnify:CR=1 FL=1
MNLNIIKIIIKELDNLDALGFMLGNVLIPMAMKTISCKHDFISFNDCHFKALFIDFLNF